MQGGQHQLAGLVRFHDADIGHYVLGAAAAQAEGFTLGFAAQVAGGGAEVDLLGEAALLVGGHQDAAVGPGGDLFGAAGAGQAHLGVVVTADDGGVDVAELIDLGATHESDIHIAALQVQGEDIVHAAHGGGAGDQGGVADGERQARRLGADHARFVDHEQVGGVGAAGQVAGQVGLADTDKDHIAVAQQASGVYDHQLSGIIGKHLFHRINLHKSPRRLRSEECLDVFKHRLRGL